MLFCSIANNENIDFTFQPSLWFTSAAWGASIRNHAPCYLTSKKKNHAAPKQCLKFRKTRNFHIELSYVRSVRCASRRPTTSFGVVHPVLIFREGAQHAPAHYPRLDLPPKPACSPALLSRSRLAGSWTLLVTTAGALALHFFFFFFLIRFLAFFRLVIIESLWDMEI